MRQRPASNKGTRVAAWVLLAIFGVTITGADTRAAESTDEQKSLDKSVVPNPKLPPLKIEIVGLKHTLPAVWPQTWIVGYDFAPHHIMDGRITIIDPLAATEAEQYKGMFNFGINPKFIVSKTRPEIYVDQNFWSRGTNGDRTQVLTIYDKTTLQQIAEIVIPPGRGTGGEDAADGTYGLSLIDNDRLLLQYNFTPATSVSVIDLDKRQIVNEIPTPGCVIPYPAGPRGFMSICANGGLLSTQLDAEGQTIKQTRVKPFFSVEDDPVFVTPAIMNGMAYFLSRHGLVHPVDLRGDVAVPLTPFPLMTDAERKANFRPGGDRLIAGHDKSGEIYVVVMPNPDESARHSLGGTEVWVADTATRKVVRKIKLRSRTSYVSVTRTDDPLMIVATKGGYDIYRARTGEFMKTQAGLGADSPVAVVLR